MDPKKVSDLEGLYRTIAGFLHIMEAESERVLPTAHSLASLDDHQTVKNLVEELKNLHNSVMASKDILWKYREVLGR
jgi:hypothetical protein